MVLLMPVLLWCSNFPGSAHRSRQSARRKRFDTSVVQVGDRVMAACHGSAKHYPGRVTAAIEGGMFSILFDDGCKDERVQSRCISKLLASSSASKSKGGSSRLEKKSSAEALL